MDKTYAILAVLTLLGGIAIGAFAPLTDGWVLCIIGVAVVASVVFMLLSEDERTYHE